MDQWPSPAFGDGIEREEHVQNSYPPHANDYRFETVGQAEKTGKSTVVKVRLVRVPDGKPVDGAVIIQTRFDMGPDGMAEMTAPAKVAGPAGEPGVYRVETKPPMAGQWALTLSAKIQGEPETVKGAVTVPIEK
jgi:hypothetical protein